MSTDRTAEGISTVASAADGVRAPVDLELDEILASMSGRNSGNVPMSASQTTAVSPPQPIPTTFQIPLGLTASSQSSTLSQGSSALSGALAPRSQTA